MVIGPFSIYLYLRRFMTDLILLRTGQATGNNQTECVEQLNDISELLAATSQLKCCLHTKSPV